MRSARSWTVSLPFDLRLRTWRFGVWRSILTTWATTGPSSVRRAYSTPGATASKGSPLAKAGAAGEARRRAESANARAGKRGAGAITPRPSAERPVAQGQEVERDRDPLGDCLG